MQRLAFKRGLTHLSNQKDINMRKEEVELLESIEKVQKRQLYLLEEPDSPQQQFLHLFAHRHLLKQNMIHKNIDNVLCLLPGSFASSSLALAYSSLCLDNKLEVPEAGQNLLQLIQGWVSYYPSLKGQKRILVGEVVLQGSISPEELQGYDLYLHYLNLISVDLWKLLLGGRPEEEFFEEKSIKTQIEEIRATDTRHLDASDLLTFVSSCIPKTLLNLVLEKGSLPSSMRNEHKRFECLFVNESVEYYLRGLQKLGVLLKTVILLVIQLDMGQSLLKMLMLVAMRYYYVFHFDRKFSAAEIFVYSFNKLTEEVRRGLADEFSLFVKVLHKLGKLKFSDFLATNSPFLKVIVEAVAKKPTIGYSQELASPYNTIGIGENILIERGRSVERYFQVLEEYSIFYYRVVVASQDINMRLFYLGEVAGRQSSKTLLFSQEKKSGTIKNCINVMKKGLYMFEFDNTFSWITGKSIRYENVVYSPLEIKSTREDAWLQDFYDGLFQNHIGSPDGIHVVQPRQTASSNSAELSTSSQGTFTLHSSTPPSSYQYQTDSPHRMREKVAQLLLTQKQLNLSINSKKVFHIQQVEAFLFAQPQREEKGAEIQYFSDDSPQKEEEESEDVKKGVDRSQIANYSKDNEEEKGDKAKEPEPRAKEQISGQAPNFYEDEDQLDVV